MCSKGWFYIAWPTGFLAGTPAFVVEPSPFVSGDGVRFDWVGVRGLGTIAPGTPFGAGGFEGRRGPLAVPGRDPCGGGP